MFVSTRVNYLTGAISLNRPVNEMSVAQGSRIALSDLDKNLCYFFARVPLSVRGKMLLVPACKKRETEREREREIADKIDG